METTAASTNVMSQDPFEDSEERESEVDIDDQAPAKSLDVSEESDFARSQASASKKRRKSASVAVASTPTEKRKKRTVDKKFLQGNFGQKILEYNDTPHQLRKRATLRSNWRQNIWWWK